MTSTDRLSDYTRDQLTHLRSLDFVRYLTCLITTDGAQVAALKMFAERWPRTISSDLIQKAAVAAGSTTDSAWAAPLVTLKPLVDAFVTLSRAASLIGKIPNLRTVPFNVQVPVQTGGGTYGWVGQSKPKPLTALAFATASLGFAKIAGLVVITEELAKLSSPSAEQTVRNDMIAGVAGFMDNQFVNPAVAAVAGVNPGSITNGITGLVPSGTDGTALVKDVDGLIAAFIAANPSVEFLTLLMTPAHAQKLGSAAKVNTIGLTGGVYAGVPVVASASVGPRIVALDAQAILVADEGETTIDVSREATLEMESAPTSPATAATVQVNLWQLNYVGFKVERFATWARARTSAVVYIEGAAYV